MQSISEKLTNLINYRNNFIGKILHNGGQIFDEKITTIKEEIPTILKNEEQNFNLFWQDYYDYIDQKLSIVNMNNLIIKSSFFENQFSLQSANFPSCTTIGSNVFSNCRSLQSVNFPVCTTIGLYAFYSCSSLQSVNFPSCITIGPSAFCTCTSLQSVNFPSCITIGASAFQYCASLSAIYLLASSICTLSHSNAFNSTPIQYSSYLGYFGSIYVPSSLVASYKTATNWTYYSSRITSYIE